MVDRLLGRPLDATGDKAGNIAGSEDAKHFGDGLVLPLWLNVAEHVDQGHDIESFRRIINPIGQTRFDFRIMAAGRLSKGVVGFNAANFAEVF